MTLALLVAALCLLAVDVVVLSAARDLRTRMLVRRSLNEVPFEPIKPLPAFERRMATETWRNDPVEMIRCVAALRWTRNRVTKYGPEVSTDPEGLLGSVESGGPAICTGMATLYRHVLAAVGLRSRLVMLQRNLFDSFDTHVTVDVRVGERWVLADPTFGVLALDTDGKYLGAEAVNSRLLTGDAVTWEAVETTGYPVEMDMYYVDPRFMFNNLFVEVASSRSVLSRFPPFRYFLGARRYYFVPAGGASDEHFRTVASLQRLLIVGIPATAVLMLLAAMLIAIL